MKNFSLGLFNGALGERALPIALHFYRGGDFLRDMDLPQRGRLPHEVPSWVATGSFFFVTINCEPRGRNQLARADRAEAVFAAAAFYHKQCTWFCQLMLLMPDHLHAIIAFPGDRPSIKRTILNWKHFLATNHSIEWQRDFFDRRLRNEADEIERTSYIMMNPVRRGLCERPEEWPYVFRMNDRLPPRLGY